MMWILITALVVLLAAPLIYLAVLDGRFEVRRKLEIEAPIDRVFEAVLDLETWPKWSPWLLHEPDAEIVYSDDCKVEGGCYSWEGSIVGAGKLTHLEIQPPYAIHQQLELLKPFKSTSRVTWTFEKQGDRTLVSWEMHGKMPFLFRFMARRMEPAIGRDYELGLAMLGGWLNARMNHPQITLHGPESLEHFRYWAIPCHGNLRQLEASRRGSIETLRAAEPARIGLSLALFHRFDPRATHYRAELAVPITDNSPQANYQPREFTGGRYFRMTLKGSLRFLPLGWHVLTSHCHMRRIRLDPERPALEIYNDDPGVVLEPNRMMTTLYLPVRE